MIPAGFQMIKYPPGDAMFSATGSFLPPSNEIQKPMVLFPFQMQNTVMPQYNDVGMSLAALHYMLMSAQLKDLIQLSPVKEIQVKEEHNDHEEKSSTSSFSIDSLLRPSSQEKEFSISSPGSDATVSYTLNALDTSDGRSRTTEKKLSSERCVCDECGKSYATSSNLSRHKQTHRSLDSPYAKQCPHCDRVYVSMPALSMHILTHKANHSCNICGKSFSRLWLLQGHLRSHTGQRPFGCADCGKSFADRSNLRAHMHTHTGEKRHGCDHCGKKFALRTYLNRHSETCRSSQTPTTN